MFVGNIKFTAGGAVINPYSILNDGLADITWIHDPEMMGVLGFHSVLYDAKLKGGLQAYKGHSSYMRGKRIKVSFEGKPNKPYEECGE